MIKESLINIIFFDLNANFLKLSDLKISYREKIMTLIKIFTIFSFALFTSLLSGCASMFQGSHQNITIATINDKLPDATRCNIKNEEGRWVASPNSAVSIHRDGNNMEIQCENNVQSGIQHVDPEFDGAYLGLDLLLDLCIISCTIDGISNSFYEYPSFITVPLKDK